ncbi:MAG: flavin oxidoreductase/NADH oxidase [Clostridia bacterium]|nr:flavin oxidoreductase/NADH oxidase [Clostridia bacterium]
MSYSVIRNQLSLAAQSREAGVEFPQSENVGTLLSPIPVGRKVAKNRILYQPMEGCDGTPQGLPDELTVRRYLRFVAGGPGIIWFEATAVQQEGRANPRQMYLCEKNVDAFRTFLDNLREQAQKSGQTPPLFICQLTHSGRYSKPTGTPAPRIAYHHALFEKEHPLSDDCIVSDEYLDRLKEDLVHGAELAQRAGFDGADIKACHRYLLSELLSAYERPGRYGGSYENRTRLLREALAGARQSTDSDFIIGSRLNLYDGFAWPLGFGVRPEGGTEPDLEEGKQLCADLAAAGADLLNVTMGNPYFNPHVNRPYAQGTYEAPEPPLYGVRRILGGAKAAKEAAPGCVVSCSGISFLGCAAPSVLSGCLEEGWFDLCGFGRETLAYPDLVRDLETKGKLDESKICICCSKCTAIMRRPGGTPGCVVRDSAVYAPLYRKYVLGKE